MSQTANVRDDLAYNSDDAHYDREPCGAGEVLSLVERLLRTDLIGAPAPAVYMPPAQSTTRAQLRADPFGLDAGDAGAPPAWAGLDIAALIAGRGVSASPRSEACGVCGGELRCEIDGLRRVCANAECAHIVEGDSTEPDDDEAPRAAAGASRLKLVGVGSGSLQPDLYRSGNGDGAATQKRQITEEFMKCRQQYIERGGRAIAISAISRAVYYYHEVQRECVKRSLNKKRIMAACLYYACIEIGYLPTNAEIADFMQLPNNGIAPGVNFIRALAADGKMSIDVASDRWKPAHAEITTLFAHLDISAEEFAPLRAAVFDVICRAASAKIGTSSFLRSKVAGATYAVLQRAALAAESSLLAPTALRAAVRVATGGLTTFCGDRIRKNTVQRFLQELDDFHANFESVWATHHLDARDGVVKM